MFTFFHMKEIPKIPVSFYKLVFMEDTRFCKKLKCPILSDIHPSGAILPRIKDMQEFRSHRGHVDGRLFHPRPLHLRPLPIHGKNKSKLQIRLLYVSFPFFYQSTHTPNSYWHPYIRTSATSTLSNPNKWHVITPR